MVVVGYGNIGSVVAKHCKGAFGMRVIGVNKFPEMVTAEEKQWCDELVGLEDLSPAGQGHVRQHLGGKEVLHDAEEAVVVVVPLEAELLQVASERIHHGCRPKSKLASTKSN